MGILAGGSSPLVADSGVQISLFDGKLRVEINGQLFTEYHYQDLPRPYFYPVLGADELAVTRKWPMEDTKDEERDHPHHRGLWYVHSPRQRDASPRSRTLPGICQI